MKDQVVRARVEGALKARAAEILAANGLDLSDGIRLFLRQVIVQGGMPFAIRRGRAVSLASARALRAMKHAAQARDRALIAQGEFARGELFLISPEQARAAQVEWPDGKLSD